MGPDLITRSEVTREDVLTINMRWKARPSPDRVRDAPDDARISSEEHVKVLSVQV